MTTALFGFCVGLNALKLNDTEVALFCAVAMMASCRPGVSNPKLIDAHRDKLLEALKIQVRRRGGRVWVVCAVLAGTAMLLPEGNKLAALSQYNQ